MGSKHNQELKYKTCQICGNKDCDTTFAGQPMHKKCKRKWKRKYGGMLR